LVLERVLTPSANIDGNAGTLRDDRAIKIALDTTHVLEQLAIAAG
jgi:hypothetical protein